MYSISLSPSLNNVVNIKSCFTSLNHIHNKQHYDSSSLLNTLSKRIKSDSSKTFFILLFLTNPTRATECGH